MKNTINKIFELISNPLSLITVGVAFFLFGSIVYFQSGVLGDYFFYLALFAVAIACVEYLWDLNTFLVEVKKDVLQENKVSTNDKNLNDDLSLQNPAPSCIMDTEISEKD